MDKEYKNILFLYYSKEIDVTAYVKEKIIRKNMDLNKHYSSNTTDPNSKTIEFNWSRSTKGKVRIGFYNNAKNYITIKTQYARNAVELYNLINSWINEFEKLTHN